MNAKPDPADVCNTVAMQFYVWDWKILVKPGKLPRHQQRARHACMYALWEFCDFSVGAIAARFRMTDSAVREALCKIHSPSAYAMEVQREAHYALGYIDGWIASRGPAR